MFGRAVVLISTSDVAGVCSAPKKWQYLTPWFLQVLLLHLAFSFALAPDTSQQDKALPVLRRCAIWKIRIHCLDQDGVETIVEVSEQNHVAFPEGEEVACVCLTHIKSPGNKGRTLSREFHH